MTNLSDINVSCCKSKQRWVSEHSCTKTDNLLPNLKFYKWYKFVWCKREREWGSEAESLTNGERLTPAGYEQESWNSDVCTPGMFVSTGMFKLESMRKLFSKTL